MLRKRILSFILILTGGLLFSPAEAEAQAPPCVSAASALLMNAAGETLFEKNADARSLIASTTKLLTALVVLERASPEETVLIRPEYTRPEGSSMALAAGEERTVRELLEGLLLASGNDAALALAYHVAGGVAPFAALMNEKAAALGLADSHFSNPHGLDAPDHYATARDLGRLMAACMEEPSLARLLVERSATIGERTLVNHNKLLELCPGCLGGKTGYTQAAGRCLVSCCEREGSRFICVTLNDPDDWRDHQTLYNWAFSRYAERRVSQALRFTVPVCGGERESAEVLARERTLLLPRSAELTAVAYLPRRAAAPIAAGQSAGRVEIFCSGERIACAELYYAAAVARREAPGSPPPDRFPG